MGLYATGGGAQAAGKNFAPENSFIFDGSLGLAQFLDMNNTNDNKASKAGGEKRRAEDANDGSGPNAKLFKYSK
ncbi:unnamed protein product [Hanseniaspora opuntiae]